MKSNYAIKLTYYRIDNGTYHISIIIMFDVISIHFNVVAYLVSLLLCFGFSTLDSNMNRKLNFKHNKYQILDFKSTFITCLLHSG